MKQSLKSRYYTNLGTLMKCTFLSSLAKCCWGNLSCDQRKGLGSGTKEALQFANWCNDIFAKASVTILQAWSGFSAITGLSVKGLLDNKSTGDLAYEMVPWSGLCPYRKQARKYKLSAFAPYLAQEWRRKEICTATTMFSYIYFFLVMKDKHLTSSHALPPIYPCLLPFPLFSFPLMPNFTLLSPLLWMYGVPILSYLSHWGC